MPKATSRASAKSKKIAPRTWTPDEGRRMIEGWFAGRGWQVLPHQTASWEAIGSGHSGILQMPTGSGKTYASFLGFLPELGGGEPGLKLLYITPLRALARDIEQALQLPCEELGLGLRVESRTGDTSQALRRRQKSELPQILITTPESLALLLTYATAPSDFAGVRGCILDEWHELLGSKRGSLLELSLTRLRRFARGMRTWALSATLPNLAEAAWAASGLGPEPRLLSFGQRRPIELRTILPDPQYRLPDAGRIGLAMLPRVLEMLDLNFSTLIFTNTRAQAELWYEALAMSQPDWENVLALHHGSLHPEVREAVERGVKEGRLRVVVCTSTLDLGVDFPEVDRVIQIGSPKRISRLVQRAGRSGHAPGANSAVWLVPTLALELFEILACRRALGAGLLEERRPWREPLDVLIQHLVSSALGGGFAADALYEEVKTAYSYRELSREVFDWALRFVVQGGGTLQAYPQYCKVVLEEGLYQVKDRTIANRHRQNIGTILSESSIAVKLGRRHLGNIEEQFVGRLRKGDRFLFAGRWLELISLKDLTAYTKLSKAAKDGLTPTWGGQRLPWSTVLSHSLRVVLDSLHAQEPLPEMEASEFEALTPIIDAQHRLSLWPASNELLVEVVQSREGQHLFMFPFEGQAVHEALAALVSYRASQSHPGSYAVAANDYGFEILSSVELPWNEAQLRAWLSPVDFETDLRAALNHAELAKRRFRSIARIAGLVIQNLPGRKHNNYQLQSSSSLLFDVFRRFEPDNLLLRQAEEEVSQQQFESERLAATLARLATLTQLWSYPETFSPLALPIHRERVSSRQSTESPLARVERMKKSWQSSVQGRSRERPSRSSRRRQSYGQERRP